MPFDGILVVETVHRQSRHYLFKLCTVSIYYNLRGVKLAPNMFLLPSSLSGYVNVCFDSHPFLPVT
jgi:hypothetical protein